MQHRIARRAAPRVLVGGLHTTRSLSERAVMEQQQNEESWNNNSTVPKKPSCTLASIPGSHFAAPPPS
ncbi:hypothetical protein E2C01_056104 [Portunus trituberculatus]|uniref:Uncharacterized protein n=1 Tax=Portunus trituberculatus TaxID=210409 RepID=A0A5B7GZG5_PORTR|nr:hypothetical protein [Portunus trituberculatus]